MIDNSIAHLDRIFDLRELVFNLKIAVLVLAAAAAAISIMMSKYIVRPIEKLAQDMEQLGGRTADENSGIKPEGRTNDEIDRLSRLYKETFVPMKGYLTTADLFLQMTEGMVSLNADGKVAFLNAHMEKLLGIQRQRYIGKHYADIFPNPARNIEIHGLIEDVMHS